MSSTLLIALIVTTTVLVALLGFSTSAASVGSILFTFPIALCAMQRSKRLLWSMAASTVLLIIAAEFWGFQRVQLVDPWDASANRGFLIASLLVLATFIHFWINRTRKIKHDAAKIAQQTGSLEAQNERLEGLTERLALAASVARLGLWNSDLRSDTLAWDDTMFEIYGFTPIVPMPYEKWSAAVFPEDLPTVEATFRSVIREKNHGSAEFRITRADGAIRNVSAMERAVLDEHGNVIRVIGVNVDITERKLAEAAFLESEERYRMLLDGIQDYAIFMMDPLGQVVSWNAGAERIKGYRAEEIIGRSFSCFFPPDDIKRGRPQEVLRLTTANGRHEEQGMRVRKDGSRFFASVNTTALRDPAGNLRGFSEFSHDLSESKESGAKYRGLLEAAPDAMVVVNQNGEIVLLNLQAEKQFGYRRDELVGQKVKNIIPEGFAERLIADGTRSAAEALAQQIGTGIELIARRKDGTEFPIEIMLSPLESAEGTLVTAAIRDISVRRAAEKHLAQMEGRYRGLLEAAPDGMVVVNQSGEIVLLNLQAEKQFGYRRDELVGQKVKNIIPQGFAERLIADGTRTAAEALAQQIGTGIELSGRRKDGSEFPIEIMLS